MHLQSYDVSDCDPERCAALTKRIVPLLAGQHPAEVGAVLAELLATWLAGHEPGMREPILKIHVELVEKFVPMIAPDLWKMN